MLELLNMDQYVHVTHAYCPIMFEIRNCKTFVILLKRFSGSPESRVGSVLKSERAPEQALELASRGEYGTPLRNAVPSSPGDRFQGLSRGTF